MFWEYERNTKLPKMRWNLKPYWRASGTQAEKSAKFGPNWLCVSGAISMMASVFNFHFIHSNFEFLSHLKKVIRTKLNDTKIFHWLLSVTNAPTLLVKHHVWKHIKNMKDTKWIDNIIADSKIAQWLSAPNWVWLIIGVNLNIGYHINHHKNLFMKCYMEKLLKKKLIRKNPKRKDAVG